MHDGNLFFKHKYPTISIEHAVERFNTFEEFEKFFTDDSQILTCNIKAGVV